MPSASDREDSATEKYRLLKVEIARSAISTKGKGAKVC